MKGVQIGIAFSLMAGVLAGCAAQQNTSTDTSQPPAGNSLLAGPALWNDPQNTPHPKWGWATLSSPPAGPTVPKWWRPINATPLPEHVTGLEHLGQAANVSQGAGIALFGSIGVVPEDGRRAHFVDISDPVHPTEVGSIESGGRGAAIIAYPNGRLVTAIATSPGFDVIEFTDPAHPKMLAQIEPSQGGHKLGIVPGTPILYNAASQGGEQAGILGPGPCNADISKCTGYTEIYNLTDPENPVLVQEFPNGLSCHHIFFWNNVTQGKYRAICAGIQYTQLWDTTDPLNPKVIVSVPVHSGQAGTPSQQASIEAFSHSAGLNIAGTVLYVGDESGGGGLPPGCAASATVPLEGSTAGTPVGATWFYDVSTETDPKVLGYFEPPIQPTTYADQNGIHSASCTTHHGRLVPEEGRDLLAMSYYGDGVILVDFTGVGTPGAPLPHTVAQFAEGSNTWETWYDQGYLFTGDLARGMDTFRLT